MTTLEYDKGNKSFLILISALWVAYSIYKTYSYITYVNKEWKGRDQELEDFGKKLDA